MAFSIPFISMKVQFSRNISVGIVGYTNYTHRWLYSIMNDFPCESYSISFSMAEQLAVTGLENWLLLSRCTVTTHWYFEGSMSHSDPSHFISSTPFTLIPTPTCRAKKGPGVSGRHHYAFPKSLMETPSMRITLHNSQSILTFINSLDLIYNDLRPEIFT